MKKIGKMWRNFKNRLTREIYDNVKEDINPESFAESHETTFKYGVRIFCLTNDERFF